MSLTIIKTANAVKITDDDSAISFVNPKVSWAFDGNELTININSSTFKEVIGSVTVDVDTPVTEGALESALSSVFPNPGGSGTPTLSDVLFEGNSAGNNRIVNLGAPQNPTDAATLESIGLYAGIVESDNGNVSLDQTRIGKTIILNSATPKNIDIAADANFDGDWLVGQKAWFIATDGPVTVVALVGATVLLPVNSTNLLTKYAKIEILKIAADTWLVSGNTEPYFVYQALLTQSGTNDPVATVLKNTIGNIVWTRPDVGQYAGTLSAAFPENKTFVLVNNQTTFTLALRVTDSIVGITTGDDSLTPKDNLLNQSAFEIRVYP